MGSNPTIGSGFGRFPVMGERGFVSKLSQKRSKITPKLLPEVGNSTTVVGKSALWWHRRIDFAFESSHLDSSRIPVPERAGEYQSYPLWHGPKSLCHRSIPKSAIALFNS
ncbi:MAG: hypothetical protein ACM65L_06180 [Microcoleus sp.]